QQPGLVAEVVRVAGDMVAPLQHQDALVELSGDTFGQHGAAEAGADDDPVETAFRHVRPVAAQGRISVEPVVSRASSARCASAACASGKRWLTCTLMSPRRMASNSALPPRRSSAAVEK